MSSEPVLIVDTPEEEDTAQFKSSNGMPRWLGDGFPGA